MDDKARFRKINRDVEDERSYEQALADVERLKADLEYVAMMAGIDIDDNGTIEEED